MQNNIYLKLGLILVLIILLLIPSSFLNDLINERIGWRQQAYDSIKQSWPGEQILAGPILIVPYQVTHQVKEKILHPIKVNNNAIKNIKVNSTTLLEKEIVKTVSFDSVLYLIPKKLTVNSNLDSTLRYRGIYGVPIYTNNLKVNGEFNLQPMIDVVNQHKDKNIIWKKPHLSVLVSDQRGIVAPPNLKWGEAKISFEPGSALPGTEVGMSAKLPEIMLAETRNMPFAFDMQLKGMGSANFALLSDDSEINLTANWANPSFTGALLPDKREITAQGFTAQWRASSFSFNLSGVLDACRKGDCNRLFENSVGSALIQPVDIYQQSERSIKYAFLFIALTFLMLILLELLKKLRVHPIQYTLVGMALLVFYLLLISLSEHIAFMLAYASGAIACTLLLTIYFGSILHSRKLGVMLGAALSLVYTLLYIILQAEETALLMGSLLLFSLLAVLMLTTRNLDWYALTSQNEANKTSSTSV